MCTVQKPRPCISQWRGTCGSFVNLAILSATLNLASFYLLLLMTLKLAPICPNVFCMGMMNYYVGKTGLGQAEQSCTLCVHMCTCLYCIVQLPDAILTSALSTNQRKALSCLLCSDWPNRWLTMEEEEMEENCHLLKMSPRVTKGL